MDVILNGKISELSARVNSIQGIVNVSVSPKAFATTTALGADSAANTVDGKTYAYLVIADGKLYYWNGSAWTAGGTYQSAGIADQSITAFKLGQDSVNLRHVRGVTDLNIFDPAEQAGANIIDNKYLNANGTQGVSTSYFISSKIQVYPGEQYTVSDMNGTSSIGGFYNSSDTWIANIDTDTFTVPANTAYLRLTVIKNSGWATTKMLYKGASLPSTYVPYGGKIAGLRSADASVGATAYVDKSITGEKIAGNEIEWRHFQRDSIFPTALKGFANANLYNKNAPDITENYYLLETGVPNANPSYRVSGKHRVTPGVEYTCTALWDTLPTGRRIHCFNDSDVRIAGIDTATFTPPDGTSYIRINIAKSLDTTGMLVEGSALPSVYTPWGVELPWLKCSAAQLTLAGNRWFGKKLNALGDSLTAASGYPELVGTALGLSVVRNYGISGSTLRTGTASSNPMVTRYTAMDNDADIVLFMGGTNDNNGTTPPGAITDSSTDTYCGALNTLCAGLIAKYPTALIIGLTPPMNNYYGYGSNLELHANALKAACAKFGIPCLDTFHDFGMNPSIAEQMAAFYTDGTHFNPAGKQRIANRVAGFIRGY